MDFRQKVRKNVKRARNDGLQVVRDETGERPEDFLEIYYSTMDRNNASDGDYFSRALFETLNRQIMEYFSISNDWFLAGLWSFSWERRLSIWRDIMIFVKAGALNLR